MLPPSQHPKTTEIFAAQKIIADISSGLYRSPAAALKELVTNAYDADATIVAIETDAPQFRTLTIRDNGSGMPIGQFLAVMSHIGGSRKRIVGGDVTPRGRKIIGRIGVGLLAVAQLGFKFVVSSSVKGSETKFVAEVDLEPFHRDDAALVSMGRMKEDGEVLIGAVRYVDEIPEEPDAHYTVITVPDARRSLTTDVSGSVRRAVGAEEKISLASSRPDNFAELVDVTRSVRRADTALDAYYYTLWELGHLCPVNYIGGTPFHENARHIEGVESVEVPYIADFAVSVDGVQLFRPQYFPSLCAEGYRSPDPKIFPIAFDRVVAGRQLKFSGYIYSQQPRIDPEEVRGVHLRIRNVGIGRYDRSWLGYPFDEGYKFGQVSGEIFVEEGLEPALNIDRDSFRETDVHFQALRAYLWTQLREEVFPQFKARQKSYTAARKVAVLNISDERYANRLASLPSPIQDYENEWWGIWENQLARTRPQWMALVREYGLDNDSTRRLQRVIVALVASELLDANSHDTLDALLAALAAAM